MFEKSRWKYLDQENLEGTMFEMFKILVTLSFIFFIPGYMIFNILNKEKLENIYLDCSEIIFLQILGSILISGWIGLVLAEFGYFSLFNLLILLIVICWILVWKYKTKIYLSFPNPKLDYMSILFITILITSIILFFHPFEWIAGGGDPGIYINTGINIAKTGSIIIYNDTTFIDIPSSMVSTFYRYSLISMPFAGLFFDRTTNEIFPQFYHLYPTWIAIFYSIFGLKYGLFITPLFGILGVVSIYFTGKRFFNNNVGIIASTLLIISLPQIWYSRYPTTEVMAQFLIFGGLYSFIIFKRTLNPYIGIISAICFGEALLTRIDSVLLLIFIMLLFGYLKLTDKITKHHFYYFIIPLTLISIHAFIHAISISKWYTFSTMGLKINSFSELIYEIDEYKIMLYILLILIGAVLTNSYMIYIQKIVSHNKRYIQCTLSIIIALTFIYFYFIRPIIDQGDTTIMGKLYNELNLVRLTWYISPLGTLLGVIGFIYMIFEKPRVHIFLIVALIFTIFFLYDAKIVSVLHWWVRRYVPVVLPSFMIAIAFILDKIKNIRYGKVVMSILLSILIMYFINIDVTLVNHVEFEGFINQTDILAKEFGDNDILIFDGGISGNILPVPLKYIYGKNTMNLRHEDPRLYQDSIDYNIIDDMINIWKYNKKNVYIINPRNDTINNLSITLIPEQKVIMNFPLMEQTYLSLPNKVQVVSVPINIYKIEVKK